MDAVSELKVKEDQRPPTIWEAIFRQIKWDYILYAYRRIILLKKINHRQMRICFQHPRSVTLCLNLEHVPR